MALPIRVRPVFIGDRGYARSTLLRPSDRLARFYETYLIPTSSCIRCGIAAPVDKCYRLTQVFVIVTRVSMSIPGTVFWERRGAAFASGVFLVLNWFSCTEGDGCGVFGAFCQESAHH
jgi:hypothetical protein